jgi:hypothetical protein
MSTDANAGTSAMSHCPSSSIVQLSGHFLQWCSGSNGRNLSDRVDREVPDILHVDDNGAVCTAESLIRLSLAPCASGETFRTIVAIAVTTASRLNLIAPLRCTTYNVFDFHGRFWECHGCRLDRNVEIVRVNIADLVQRVALEGNATLIPRHSRQEAHMKKTAAHRMLVYRKEAKAKN